MRTRRCRADYKDMPSPTLLEEQGRLIDELVALEETSLLRELAEDQRERWRALCCELFGAMPDHDRRRFFRIHTQRAARIVGPGVDDEATVTSLSAGGLCLQSRMASPELIGRTVEVELTLPTLVPQKLRCSVEVCWVAPVEGHGDATGMGVRFVDLDDGARRAVLAHCRQQLRWLVEVSQHKYRFFFEHSADVAMLLDPAGRIREVSAQGAELLGRPTGELVGMSVEQLLDPESREALQLAMEKLPESGRSRHPAHFRLADGRTLPVDLQLVSLTLAGLPVGSILVAHSLLERERVQLQQRELERRLFQADKLATIGQIAASVAHDINNPLAYMHANLARLVDHIEPTRHALLARQALLEGDGDVDGAQAVADAHAELAELVEDTFEGCRRIRDIMRELHDFSRVDGGGKVRIDVNKAIETALRIVKNLVKHRAKLTLDLAPDLPAVNGNFGRLSQVLINLLSNAAQSFAAKDASRNEVVVCTRAADDLVHIEIRDNGAGIAPEALPHIFEPFFTTRREDGGTGLGLAIARENTELLGGTLTVESELDGGTRFMVALPARRASQPSRPSGVPSSERRPGRDRKILVIDDEPALLRSLRRVLGRAYQVTLTVSPKEALELVAQQAFDAVVCDVMIPEMDGLTFFAELRRLQPALAGRVVFMTGGTFSPKETAELRGIGRPVLRKPVDADVLLRAVAEMMPEVGVSG